MPTAFCRANMPASERRTKITSVWNTGLSFSNVPRRISAGFVYNLPGTQRLRPLFNGWQMSGVITLQDGTPLNPFYFTEDSSIQAHLTVRTWYRDKL